MPANGPLDFALCLLLPNAPSPTHNSGSCWAHGAMSSLADRTKIMRKAVWPDINFAIQVILNCGQDIAGTCDGGDPGTMHASGTCHTQSSPWLACLRACCLMDEVFSLVLCGAGGAFQYVQQAGTCAVNHPLRLSSSFALQPALRFARCNSLNLLLLLLLL